MFGRFKKNNADRKTKKLEMSYRQRLEKARAAQRAGNMPAFATLTAEAEAIGRELDRARNATKA